MHSTVTKLCAVTGWGTSCRNQNTNCPSLTKSKEDRNKGPHNLTLFGALSKLSLLRVVINQNEINKRKYRIFKIFCHNYFKISTPYIFAVSHSFFIPTKCTWCIKYTHTHIYITINLLHFSVFFTPSSGWPLRYLLKSYMFVQRCYVVCAIKCKIYPVLKFTVLLQCLKQ